MFLLKKALHVMLVLASIIAPMFVSMLVVRYQSYWGVALAVILTYLIVAILPCAKKHESIWVFLVSMFTCAPVNIKMMFLIFQYLNEGEWIVLWILRGLICYAVLFSIEEVIFAYFARVIWKRQRLVEIEWEDW